MPLPGLDRPSPEHPHQPENLTAPTGDVTLSTADPRTCPACTTSARVMVVMSRMGLATVVETR